MSCGSDSKFNEAALLACNTGTRHDHGLYYHWNLHSTTGSPYSSCVGYGIMGYGSCLDDNGFNGSWLRLSETLGISVSSLTGLVRPRRVHSGDPAALILNPKSDWSANKSCPELHRYLRTSSCTDSVNGIVGWNGPICMVVVLMLHLLLNGCGLLADG